MSLPMMPRFASHRKLASILREHLDRANRRKRPSGSAPALVEPPHGPAPLAGGAAVPLEFED
jgi:hypothetical protein